MKKKSCLKSITAFVISSVILSSCGIFGIHLKVHNPKIPGKYPKETLENSLLSQESIYRNCFDVTHYDISINIDPAKKFIAGKVIISSSALTHFDSLQIDLYKNMHIQSIKSTNNPVSYIRKEGAVFIDMGRKINKGEKFELTIIYDGAPQVAKRPPWDGGFVWKKDTEGNDWVGVACESEGSSLWWPSKDIMNDKADSIDIHLTVPTDYVAVSNGILKHQTQTDSNSTYNWHVSYPINNYNITFYMGRYKLLPDKYLSAVTGKTTELNHYVLGKNYHTAKVHFNQVKYHLAFYEKMFGEYPWQKDGFKLIESPYAGMEHQSAIAYGNGYKNDYEDVFDYIILHETAHEWWGNSVTAADLSDGWIHEGFASYCEALYVEHIKGREAYLNYLSYQKITIKNKRPLVRKRGIRYFDYHDPDIYSKGSWVLHTLRNTLENDSLFFQLIKSFRIENNKKPIFSETFIDHVNKKTNQDYNWFFKQYLFNRKAPFLEFYWHNDILYYVWRNTDKDFKLPIKAELSDKILLLYPSTEIQAIKLSGNYKNVRFNSNELYYGTKENKYLEWDFNNAKN